MRVPGGLPALASQDYTVLRVVAPEGFRVAAHCAATADGAPVTCGGEETRVGVLLDFPPGAENFTLEVTNPAAAPEENVWRVEAYATDFGVLGTVELVREALQAGVGAAAVSAPLPGFILWTFTASVEPATTARSLP